MDNPRDFDCCAAAATAASKPAIPADEKDEPITYRTEVFQALGTASMCWTETPRGVFESERAAELGDRLVALHDAHISQARAAERERIVEELRTGERFAWYRDAANCIADVLEQP